MDYSLELPRDIRTQTLIKYFERILSCCCLFQDEENNYGKRFAYFGSSNSKKDTEFRRRYNVFIPTKSGLVLPHHITRSLAISVINSNGEKPVDFSWVSRDLELMAKSEEISSMPFYDIPFRRLREIDRELSSN